MKKKTIALALAVISLAAYAAQKYGTSLKNHPIPRAGCYPVEKISLNEAKELIASQNLKTVNATNAEIKSLGAAIYWTQYLNDGVLRSGIAPKGYEVRLVGGNPGSAQRHDHLRIDKRWGTSVAQHVHEWAHLIGNNGGYAGYKKALGLPNKGTTTKSTTSLKNKFCMVSGYADNNPSRNEVRYVNEQFAEVFTAFVTEPGLLIDSQSEPCRRAFDFFLDWFDAGNRVYECYDKQN